MSSVEEREVLESWKEISDYLKRDIKTCRRWETEHSLPIRRLDSTPKARVFAYKEELEHWLEDKLNNRKISTTEYLRIPKKKSKTLWVVLSIALLLLIITVAGIRFIPKINFGPPSPGKTHLAVLPIQDYTNDDSPTPVQEALTNLIVYDLYQSRYIRVMTAERMNKILDDLDKSDSDSFTTDDLKKIASMDGVTHFLSGSATKFGEKIRLNLALQEARSWKTTWTGHMEGIKNNMFDMVDALTIRLKTQLNLTDDQIADDFDKAVANVTTPNERALYFYIQARRAMNNTEWMLAEENFLKATTLDPDFAMAYRFLSGLYNHLALETGDQSYWDKLHEAGKKSHAAARRRPPSERELLIIQGAYIDPDSVSETVKVEMETFKKLLELYPDDDYGNYRLAVRYFQGETYDRTEKHFKRIVDFTINPFAFYILSNVYLHQRRYDEAGELLEQGVERFPNNFYMFQRMAQLHAMRQDFDDALYWCDRGFEVEPVQFRDSLTRGDVLFFMGDFDASEFEYRLCHNSKNNKARIDAAISLMQLYKTQGRFEDAVVQAETAMQTLKKNRGWDFDSFHAELSRMDRRRGHIKEALRRANKVVDKSTKFKLKGDVYLLTQQRTKLKDLQDEITELVRKSNDNEWARYLDQNNMERPFCQRQLKSLYHIRAKAALDNRDYGQAIAHAEQAKDLYAGVNLIPADLIEILGKAYYESGDLKSAKNQFEWIAQMTYSRKEYGDIYAKSFYMLGKIYEKLGKKQEAKSNYEKFLDLWKNADPGLLEVDDARTRLDAL